MIYLFSNHGTSVPLKKKKSTVVRRYQTSGVVELVARYGTLEKYFECISRFYNLTNFILIERPGKETN